MHILEILSGWEGCKEGWKAGWGGVGMGVDGLEQDGKKYNGKAHISVKLNKKDTFFGLFFWVMKSYNVYVVIEFELLFFMNLWNWLEI